MVPTAKNNKRAASMEVEPLMKKYKYGNNEITSQTLKLEKRNITINENELLDSRTNKKKFFEEYEFGELIAEGGNGAVFKGKIFFLK